MFWSEEGIGKERHAALNEVLCLLSVWLAVWPAGLGTGLAEGCPLAC